MTVVVEQILRNYQVLYWIAAETGNRSPILTTLKEKMQEHKFINYLNERDDDRENRGKNREYEHGSYALTAQIWNIQGRPMISSAWLAKANRHIYDKLLHGEHRALFARPTEDREELSRCPICGGKDSNRHIIIECHNPSSAKVRDNTIRLMRKVMEDKKYEKDVNKPFKQWEDIIIEQITNNESTTNHPL